MHRRAALITAIAVASALRGGIVPQGVRRIAVSDGVQPTEVDALIAAARDCVGVSYASTRIDNARRCAIFESLDEGIEPLIEYWDEIGGAPLLMLADDQSWDDSCNVTARAAAAVDRFAAQHALLKPLSTRPAAAKHVVAENVAIDGSYVDHGGDRWFDTSRVAAVDGLVDEALSASLLKAMRARPDGVGGVEILQAGRREAPARAG